MSEIHRFSANIKKALSIIQGIKKGPLREFLKKKRI